MLTIVYGPKVFLLKAKCTVVWLVDRMRCIKYLLKLFQCFTTHIKSHFSDSSRKSISNYIIVPVVLGTSESCCCRTRNNVPNMNHRSLGSDSQKEGFLGRSLLFSGCPRKPLWPPPCCIFPHNTLFPSCPLESPPRRTYWHVSAVRGWP